MPKAMSLEPKPTSVIDRLPVGTVLPLFAAGFLGILNETVPAGLLPRIARSLQVSESAAGQIIAVYAIATALTAIPLIALLRRYSLRGLLIGALIGFAICDLVPVVSKSYILILAARILGGSERALSGRISVDTRLDFPLQRCRGAQ
jgi:predicted MFS family arabinose efflux permease